MSTPVESAEEREHERDATTVVELENVTKEFALEDSLIDRLFGTRTTITAVSGVSLNVYEGETLGIVGESGSGKSTLANLVTGLHTPTAGDVRIDGRAVRSVSGRSNQLLADFGVIFQNAKSSIDPRMTVAQAIAEPLKTQGWSRVERKDRITELLEQVNLSARYVDRYAHELSGGQAQRVAIARAIATEPRVLILDEPVSALDASVKGIINLLLRLQRELDLTYVLISHDLSVVKHIADRIAVMYLGELMEVGEAERLFTSPGHPYTEALLASIPDLDPTTSVLDATILEGDIPSPVDPPSGCVFHTRCPIAEDQCRTDVPNVVDLEGTVSSATSQSVSLERATRRTMDHDSR
ncbi:ABC transporter ATP-binding protein [Saliphagus sp. GCM10025308]